MFAELRSEGQPAPVQQDHEEYAPAPLPMPRVDHKIIVTATTAPMSTRGNPSPARARKGVSSRTSVFAPPPVTRFGDDDVR
jgi:hypothetical protein